MDDSLEQRVSAVERALTDGDQDLSALADVGAVTDQMDGLESDIADLSDRVAELEAATQALRGYVGAVRAVNREVEQRADAALAAATGGELETGQCTRSDGRATSTQSECLRCGDLQGSSTESRNPSASESPDFTTETPTSPRSRDPAEDARQAIRASRNGASQREPEDGQSERKDPGLLGQIRNRL
jgi:hypothetical protein